jgi:CrcB protein
MQLELLKMIDAHAWGMLATYTAASVVAGFLAVHLATVFVRRTWLPR